MAGECADDDDARATINELRNAVLDELKMHNSVVQVKFPISSILCLNYTEAIVHQSRISHIIC